MSDRSPKQLVLVDGSSFLFRAYHAVPSLVNTAGEPTHAIYGVVNMLRKLRLDHKTDYFTVVFDAPGKNFRHELYTQYKINRPPMPDDLRDQIKPLHALINAMGLPVIIESGVEADDVLGVLAQYAAREGFKVVIATSDKDLAQLVTEQITLENTMSNTTLNIDGVIQKFGVKPEQMIDYLALIGDTSDDIPGVPKVGSKTAAKWLAEYGTLTNLVNNAEKIKGKVGESLRTHLEQLSLSKQLTTIKCDLVLPYTLDDLKCRAADNKALREQLKQLGFSTWLRQLEATHYEEESKRQITDEISDDDQTILTQDHFEQWLTQLNQAECFAFNIETSHLNDPNTQLVGLSLAIENGKAAYLPLVHDYPDVPVQLNKEDVINALKPLLENPNKTKIVQNLKYHVTILAKNAIEMQGVTDDILLQSYVLNSTATKHTIGDLAKKYLQIETLSYERVAGKGAKQILFSEVALEQASVYASENVNITLKLHQYLSAKLNHNTRLEKLYQDVERPLATVLFSMEKQGVLIDSAMLVEQSLILANHIIAQEQHAHDLAGRVFNLASPKQIQDIFYEQLKLPVLKKTPKGQPSTAESVLQELALNYPLPKLILEFRSMSKLKSTYTDKLPQQVNNKTGRVHTSYHQTITATGRLSSSNPNLQNIPIRSAEGRKIRQAFIAPSGYKLLAADYSQIELRIMAHLSADENLLKAFSNGMDIHRATAAEVFAVTIDQVTTDQRRSAKAINFGLIYGMSAFGLAQQLGLSRTESKSYIDLYFSRYPKVKQYMDSIREQAREQGYVETLFGRRLYLPEIKSRQAARRQYAERTAINAPMQGTAADIIKIAMIQIDQWLRETHSENKMIMQVHDELVFEVAEQHTENFSQSIRKIMCSVAQLDVPLIVDIGVGDHWDEAH